MPTRSVDYLLIGGGLASANCARWLRESGADGSILLVGREPDPPYNRPPCSKGYLQGAESREETYFRPNEWWEEQKIDVRTRTSVMKLDPGERVATLSTKEEIGFDRALIATGANVRRLRVEGSELEGIHWHQQRADAFWGPSIHWNRYLKQYVMLLNRAVASDFTPENVYVSFNSNLDPHGWSDPRPVIGADGWYPQVIGTRRHKRETDKLAGQELGAFESFLRRCGFGFEPVLLCKASRQRREPYQGQKRCRVSSGTYWVKGRTEAELS